MHTSMELLSFALFYDQVLLLAERNFMRPSYFTLPATGKGINLNHYSRWSGYSGELNSHNVDMC
jgi:hypothetical protein